jgi:uncharacterized membrane protein YphA (DoxX/SURF4 family)
MTRIAVRVFGEGMMQKQWLSYLFSPAWQYQPALSIALLLLRLYAGYTIMVAGLDKLPLTDWMVEQVTALHFPWPTFFAWLASFSEFGFGFLLIIGLLTRLAAFNLAIVMGVAAFAFQGVLPFLQMHIAQHFFWIFVTLILLGGGRYSLDSQLRERGRLLLGPAVLGILLAIGLWREATAKEPDNTAAEAAAETTLHLAGSFNNWNPTLDTLRQATDGRLYIDKSFDQAMPIAFKFTVNGSWDINLGEANQSADRFPLAGIAERNSEAIANIEAYIPAPGSYRFRFDPGTFAYRLDSLATTTPAVDK